MMHWIHRTPRTGLALTLTLVLVLAACGGGSKGASSTTSREAKDPRTVPTATPPSATPTALAAIDTGASAVRKGTAVPDVYVVKAGDTPAGIAQELGIDLAELLRANNIDDPRSLKVGQQLRVPRPPTPTPTPRPGSTVIGGRTTATPVGARTPGATSTVAATPTAGAGGTYTVQSGDTACEIATKLGVPLTALAEANGTTVAGLAALSIGQSLKVPTTKGPPGC